MNAPGKSAPGAPLETSVSSLARHSLVYSLAPLAQRFIALLLVRLYTNYLVPAQYAVLSNLDLLFTAVIQISGTNVLSAVMRFYFDQKEERDRRAVISSVIVFMSAISWTLVALAVVFRHPLTAYLFNMHDPALADDNLVKCLIVSLATIPLALCSEAAFRYLQIQQRSALVTTLRVSKSTLEMGLKVLFLVGFENGIIGFLLASFIGELITNLFLTGWVVSRTGLRFSWRVLRPMLIYAAPLVLVGFCQMVLNRIDSLMLVKLLPDEKAMDVAGVYAQGFQIGWLVQIVVVGSFMQIWQPWIFAVRDEERRRELVKHVSTWALFAVGIVSMGLELFGREAVWILSGQAKYWPAYHVVPWLAAAYVFFALNGLSQVPMFIAKRTWPMFWLNVAAAAIKVALNFALIPLYGMSGAAAATLMTFILLGVCGQFLAQRLVGSRFEHGRMAAMLALVLGVMAISLWIDATFTRDAKPIFTAMSAVKGAVFVGVAALTWKVLLHADEREQIVSRVRAKLQR